MSGDEQAVTSTPPWLICIMKGTEMGRIIGG